MSSSSPPVADNPAYTERWWTLLKFIAVANLLFWLATALTVDHSGELVVPHLILSGIYATVCAFRSFRPRIDLERTVLVDDRASSIVAGRSAATIAEVSFAIQIGLAVRQVGLAAGMEPFQVVVPVLIVVALTTAQMFCWWSVVSLSHLGHAIEESLWGLTFAGVGLSMAVMLPHLTGVLWWSALIAIPICAAYVAFMAFVDVPMYIRRWREGDGAQFGLAEGFRDALYRREATRSWTVWKPEVAWLTGYFSGAVWASIGLVYFAGL